MGQDQLFEVVSRLRAGMFIGEEEDQAAPPLRGLVPEQPALAARPRKSSSRREEALELIRSSWDLSLVTSAATSKGMSECPASVE